MRPAQSENLLPAITVSICLPTPNRTSFQANAIRGHALAGWRSPSSSTTLSLMKMSPRRSLSGRCACPGRNGSDDLARDAIEALSSAPRGPFDPAWNCPRGGAHVRLGRRTSQNWTSDPPTFVSTDPIAACRKPQAHKSPDAPSSFLAVFFRKSDSVQKSENSANRRNSRPRSDLPVFF